MGPEKERQGGAGGRWMAARILAVMVCVGLVVAGCAETQFMAETAKTMNDGSSVEGSRSTGRYKVGKPYQVAGVWYYPAVDYDYVETGIASWYGPKFHRRPTANGEIFDMNKISAAHRTLPLPSIVRVTNLENGRSLMVRVNDRGPFAHGRIIDVSRRSAQLLGFMRKGTARVRVEVVPDASRRLAARDQPGVTAATGSAITSEALPRTPVEQAALTPPPGARVAPQAPAAAGNPPAGKLEIARAATQETKVAPAEINGHVSLRPVGESDIYVQAGSFSFYENAVRLRARLSGLGQSGISRAMVDGRDVFRVRLGPVASVDQADLLLGRLISSGYPDSRIVID